MEIYFDRQLLRMMCFICRKKDKGVSWGELRNKFGDDLACPEQLINLSKELYLVTQNQNGEWVKFEDWDGRIFDGFRSFTTPKSNEMLEKRCFGFWKWVIPTLISIAALALSTITLLFSVYGNDIIKVLLV